MKQFPHDLRPILMWALLSALIFFAVGYLLGVLLKIEPLWQISKMAFCLSALSLLMTSPFKPFWWTFQVFKQLAHPSKPILM